MDEAKSYSSPGTWFRMYVIYGEEVIDLHTWGTPNGRKVAIMLEELELEYEIHQVNIGEGEQHHSDFLSISLQFLGCVLKSKSALAHRFADDFPISFEFFQSEHECEPCLSNSL